MKKLLFIALLSLTIVNCSLIADQDCPKARLTSCAEPIMTVIEQCSAEANPKACIDDQLQHIPHCLSCVCKFIPDLCIDENEETEEEQQRIQELNTNLQKKVATCSPQEIFKCKNHVMKVIRDCNRKINCVNFELQESTCSICLCTIDPDLCNQEQVKDVNKERVEEQKKTSPFDFLQNIMGMVAPQKDNKKNEQPTDVFGMINEAAKMANTVSSLFSAFSGNQEQKKEEPKRQQQQNNYQNNNNKDKNQINPFNVGDALKLLGTAQGASLLQGMNLSEDDLAETQTDDFQNMYQNIMEKMMSNPQLIAKLLPMAADPSKIDMSAMQEIIGSDLLGSLVGDMTTKKEEPKVQQQPKKEKCDDQTYNECKWEVLNILPSCLKDDAQTCIFNLLGKGNKCLGCICQIVPQAC